MTQKEVREQLELCEKATPGPWKAENCETETPGTTWWHVTSRKTTIHEGYYSTLEKDCRFTASARNNYPALLKQLDEAMRFLKEGHDHFHRHLGDHDNCLVRDAVRAYFGETR